MPKVIGFEGGPCSGKTTTSEHLLTEAQVREREIFAIAETATEMIGELAVVGLDIVDIQSYPPTRYTFQKELQRRNIEKILQAKQQVPEHAIIIHDRPDNSSYLPKPDHVQICQELGYDTNPTFVLTDTLIYLRSLAHTNAKQYERLKASNAARYETVEQAQAQCDANLEAVQDHPNFYLVAEPSVERMLGTVSRIVF